jgi:hypothetical protein
MRIVPGPRELRMVVLYLVAAVLALLWGFAMAGGRW